MATEEQSKCADLNKGIAGAMDNDVRHYDFTCHQCGKGMDTPDIAAGGPMRFWCSKDCHLRTVAQ